MTDGLTVIEPGLHTTVQDLGRYGYQQFGVPVSGALDVDSLRLANILTGNAADCAALEMLYQGAILEVTAERVCVAVGGMGAGLQILGDTPQSVDAWQTVTLERQARFRVVLGGDACVCYLAIAGGLALSPVLGSLSTYTRSGLGGYLGRPLRAGDALPLQRASAPSAEPYRLANAPDPGFSRPIRCTWGIQKDFFTERSHDAFVSEPFAIQAESDRMGFRLSGPVLEHVGAYDIVSDGIATGAIQVPGNGNPIVLMADRQTTGGYPKIANVISADLSTLGRRRPGHEIRFEIVDIETAEEIRRAHEKYLRALESGIETVAATKAIDLDVLYSTNLISGVISGD